MAPLAEAFARDFAIRAHGDQKYGSEPYVAHLDAVVAVLNEFGYSGDEYVCSGYLHDKQENEQFWQVLDFLLRDK
jgi:(p)ppGpp synthase/HD superfamily hydrolase